MTGFTEVVSNFVAETEEKGLAIIKLAITKVVEETQIPKAKEGGRMPVDTGFLRSSGAALINGIPSGKTEGRRRLPGETSKPLPDYPLTDSFGIINKLLIKLKPGDTFYFGWTARYARHAEARDAFLASAVQKWQSFIDAAVGRLKK